MGSDGFLFWLISDGGGTPAGGCALLYAVDGLPPILASLAGGWFGVCEVVRSEGIPPILRGMP